MTSDKSTTPVEPKVYPSGLKLFEVEFDYKCDIGVPGTRPIDVRFKQNDKAIDLSCVQIERMQGSVIIDTSRKSGSKRGKNQTSSVKRIPKNTGTLVIGLEGTEPLHYRISKYTRIVTPSYRSKVRVRTFTNAETTSEVTKKTMKVFNQFLKAYRVASGDPVPYISEDEDKELRIVNFWYTKLSDDSLDDSVNLDGVMNILHDTQLLNQGGPQMGINTHEVDMKPKPYIKPVVLETVKLALLPEEISAHKDLILDAIEIAHRSQDYGMAIVMLNTAFEAAITESVITSLVFLDYDIPAIDKYFEENSRLESKRKAVDSLREQACKKYGVPVPKKFRGSGEESRWNDSTYQKRHWGVHIVRDRNARPLKRDDFQKALRDTQEAIRALEVPLESLKQARKAMRAQKK